MSLDDLIGHEPGKAEAFFKKTYVTHGMHTLCGSSTAFCSTRHERPAGRWMLVGGRT